MTRRAPLTGPAQMSETEVAVLRLLAEKPLHRTIVVEKIAAPRPGGRSSQVCALIFGSWSARLAARGLVEDQEHASGHYASHAITVAGLRWLREFDETAFLRRPTASPEYVEGP